MVELTQLVGLPARVDEALRRARANGLAWVVGYNGDGRNSAAERLASDRGSVLVRLRPLADADAPLHGLLQAAGPLGEEAVRVAADDRKPLQDRAACVAQSLAEARRLVVLLIPESWEDVTTAAEDPSAELARARGSELLRGLLGVRSLSLAITSSRSFPLGTFVSGPSARAARVELARCFVQPAKLPPPSDWGAYEDAAKRLGALVQDRHLELSPLQFRLAVASVALGENVTEVCRTVEESGAKGDLLALHRRLTAALDRDEHGSLRHVLLRFLQARTSLPAAEVKRVSGVPDEHLPLLTECVGYGEPVRTTESVRLELLRHLSRRVPTSRTAEEAHRALADYHERLDGAARPTEAAGRIEHWLEKAHHLAHGGPETTDRWSALELGAREFYWDRARALSIGSRDYAGAAKVYRECLEKVDRCDDYSWHYLAWNLDRAGELGPEVEEGFRRAVELDDGNPWWNARLVRYLIGAARFAAADRAWGEVIERLDGEGRRVAESAWFAENVHSPVADAWLAAGESARAAQVLRAVPHAIFEQSAALWDLRQRVLDAEEAAGLGESVYPSDVPVEDRWKGPRLVPATYQGAALVRWYPGRVKSVGGGAILAVATPDERRLFAKTLTGEELARSGAPRLAQGAFVEVGTYADGTVRIAVDERPAVAADGRRAVRSRLRHLRRWASR